MYGCQPAILTLKDLADSSRRRYGLTFVAPLINFLHLSISCRMSSGHSLVKSI